MNSKEKDWVKETRKFETNLHKYGIKWVTDRKNVYINNLPNIIIHLQDSNVLNQISEKFLEELKYYRAGDFECIKILINIVLNPYTDVNSVEKIVSNLVDGSYPYRKKFFLSVLDRLPFGEKYFTVMKMKKSNIMFIEIFCKETIDKNKLDYFSSHPDVLVRNSVASNSETPITTVMKMSSFNNNYFKNNRMEPQHVKIPMSPKAWNVLTQSRWGEACEVLKSYGFNEPNKNSWEYVLLALNNNITPEDFVSIYINLPYEILEKL